jgi:hypothetical protein
MVTFLGLLLAFNAMACNGPTRPSDDELVRIYTGRWRGTINGFEVALDVQATRGRPQGGIPVDLGGSATARNPGTGGTHRLNIRGGTVGLSWNSFRLEIPPELGPGGVIVRSEQVTGDFNGSLSPDRRTWTGSWRSWVGANAAPIFGPDGGPFTLTKD